MNTVMPFMFNVYHDVECSKYAYTEVMIASWDLIVSSHQFNSEKDAINFISEWWKNNANVSFTILKTTFLDPEDCNGLPYCEPPISHDEFINDEIDE